VDTKAKVIVFCGVRFMAETAAILNPDKIVLLPDEEAGCELADMATVKALKAKRKKYPGVPVVSYVNTTDAIKAESDICCTSANAVDVVNSLDRDKVLFLPDKNLGSHVAEKTDKKVILWDGYCYVHEKNITPKKIEELKKAYPDAKVVVHPECNKPVRDLANFIGGTGQIREYVKESKAGEFIVGTEDGIIHTLKKENPGKIFYPLETICKGMKKINLEKVKLSLERMEHRVYIPEEIVLRARKALEKMLGV
ncbi:MAG: quinolinate synthase NadA, partial [Candidatus Aenigmarchaeota archaeon]|nr:quinolinate synthase NadA [Candidatus Aenigmarchaeota archaeon]